jgi:protein TonB
MFGNLVASSASGSEVLDWSGRAASLLLHGALVSVAVWATSSARPEAAEPPLVPVNLEWTVEKTRPPDTPAALPGRPAAPAPVSPALVTPDLPPAIISEPVPGPVLEPGIADPATPPLAPGRTPPAAATSGGFFESSVVEEMPVLIHHPPVRYPEMLRRAGVEGRVVIEVVLDSLGRPEAPSLRVVTADHVLFEPEAAAVVLGSRYRPARLSGRPVRVRIRVPVAFGLRRL